MSVRCFLIINWCWKIEPTVGGTIWEDDLGLYKKTDWSGARARISACFLPLLLLQFLFWLTSDRAAATWSVSWKKPSPPQVAMGQSVYHSKGKQTRTNTIVQSYAIWKAKAAKEEIPSVLQDFRLGCPPSREHAFCHLYEARWRKIINIFVRALKRNCAFWIFFFSKRNEKKMLRDNRVLFLIS